MKVGSLDLTRMTRWLSSRNRTTRLDGSDWLLVHRDGEERAKRVRPALIVPDGAVDTDQLAAGAVTDDKVTSVATTKLTGTVTDAQIAGMSTSKLSGTVHRVTILETPYSNRNASTASTAVPKNAGSAIKVGSVTFTAPRSGLYAWTINAGISITATDANPTDNRYILYAAPYSSVDGVGTYIKVGSLYHPTVLDGFAMQTHTNFGFGGATVFSAGSVEIGVYAYYTQTSGSQNPFAVNCVGCQASLAEV